MEMTEIRYNLVLNKLRSIVQELFNESELQEFDRVIKEMKENKESYSFQINQMLEQVYEVWLENYPINYV